ncbi:MAG: 3-oxoadipate enol-lactonase, partial [Hyphomicrobiales bacterium]|nr:3-oxoadipate enol-lactonase [Hyphomicrobiales bacterium]
MDVVRTSGATLHVEADLAPGRPAIIFVNSLGSDLRIWDEVVAAARGAGYGALRYDLRGQGLSDIGTTPYRIADHVADLEAVLAAHGIARAAVCGLSVGGMIALGLAEKRPDLVAALVLCCTGHRIGTADSWNARIAAVEAGGVKAIAETVLRGWFSPSAYRDNAPGVALCRNMLSRSPVDGYVATCAALREADFEAAARGVTAPTLCIAGEYDRATTPELLTALAALIPGARLAVIPGAGHMPCVETPSVLADHLLGFLSEIFAHADRFSAGMAVRRHV